jgi:dihydrofolate reductase
MRVSIIAAMSRNHVIGTRSGLPWHLPRDLKQFRTLTVGKPVVLGRRTLEHIGHPLPDRANVVLTRQTDFAGEGIRVAHSVSEALELARQEAERLGADEVMVIGGGEVYRAFLPVADRLYLTIVGGEFEGTATFPVAQLAQYRFAAVSQVSHPADAKNPHPLTFWQLDRIREDSAAPLPHGPLPGLLGVA